MHQLLLRSLPCDKPEWIEKCFLQLPPTVTSTAEELEIYEERCIPAMSNAMASLSAEMEKGQNLSDENVPYLAYSGEDLLSSNPELDTNCHSSQMGQMGSEQTGSRDYSP